MNSNIFLAKVGDHYQDFILNKITHIEEIGCILREIVHIPSGAEIVHLENDDPENLFCLSFKTHPYNSNGVAHILEHTVLCGSKKYPIKDPFFSMERRSLNTFMNALTGADFTCYPAASQVEKDFYNLLDVYIDAVFHPQLKLASFLQEGHRLEFSSPEDSSTPLKHNGVVFNEMKGAMSNIDARIWHDTLKTLMPNLLYAYNSGGDPKIIPSLSYEDLISFHETYYHPSRCTFFFYGNLPLKEHLDFVKEKALKNVDKESTIPPIPKQKRFLEPVKKTFPYPATKGEDNKPILVLGYLTTSAKSQDEILALCVLDLLLMGTDASPLKRAILDSKLCSNVDSLLETDMSEAPYIYLCRGCQEKKIDELQELIKSFLEKTVQKGVPSHLVESAIHQLEFERTEIVGGSMPFGLSLFLRSILPRQHGDATENALLIHSLFNDLRLKVKDPRFFPNLIKKYILDNPHAVRLILLPDENLLAKEHKEEDEGLAVLQKNLKKEQIDQIIENYKLLKQYREESENQSLECLPKIHITDVPKKAQNIPLSQNKFETLEVFHHNCFTNQIVYADLFFDIPNLGEKELTYLPLFCYLLPQLGTGNRDFKDNLEYIQSNTGGVGMSPSLHVQARDKDKVRPSISISGKSLYRKADKLFYLLRRFAISPLFNEKKRIKELILQLHLSMQTNLNSNALSYASQLSLAGFSQSNYLSNLWHGLPFFNLIKNLSEKIDSEIDDLMKFLNKLKDKVLCTAHPQLVLSCDEKMYTLLEKEGFYGLKDLPLGETAQWEDLIGLPEIGSQLRKISTPLSYSTQATETIGFTHKHAPALNIAAELFDNKILHKKIREEGGAYGSGANFHSLSGNFYFYSYRDPNIVRTKDTFNEAIKEIVNLKFTDQELEEAKLGVIQKLDSPIPPGARAKTAYRWHRSGITYDMRQDYRDRLLRLTKNEVAEAVKEELLAKTNFSIFVSFANEDLLNKENAILTERGEPLPILSV